MRPLVHLNECVFHHQFALGPCTSTLLQHVWGQCRRCEAGLLLNQPAQSRRVDMRRARRTGLSVVFRHSPRRSSRRESKACARGYTLRRSEPKVMLLQVNGLVDDSAAPLPRRPILERLAGDRLKSGRGASSGWRPVTGPSEWGPEAEPRLRLCPNKGSPLHP